MRATRVSALWTAVAVIVILPLALSAQMQAPPKTNLKMAQLGQIRTITVQAPLEVKNVLAKKKPLDVQLLQRSVTYRQNIPMLRLKSGKQVALLPLEEPFQPGPKERAGASVLIAPLNPYTQYIQHKVLDPRIVGALLGTVVDHTSCQTPIRDQLDRNTCTAFASVAGLEAFEKCKKSATLDLSEQHAYHISMQNVASTCPADPGAMTYRTAAYLTSSHICNETQMMYTNHASLPASDAAHVPAACASAARYGFSDTQLILGTAFGGPADLNANNTAYLESLLKAGYDIVYGQYVAGTDWSDGTAETGVIDVQTVGGAPAPAYAGHAMLIIGYNRPGQYFVFKNSWGPGTGHAGYLHISYDYIRTYGKYGYIIKAVTD